MYLTAHRVEDPSTTRAGINAFHFSHGARSWDGPPPDGIPDDEPGTLVGERIEVTPGGNRVRSYLDVIAPDVTPCPEVRSALVAFVTHAAASPLPWCGLAGRCLFRVGLDAALADEWQREIADLYRSVLAVRLGG